jgi:A/G-specific adenine glycosylase
MLQQTRVAAVLEHYERFLKLFPTVVALALAPEEDVLAAWSGLGYYRRARMLHKAAQFVVAELDGRIPKTAVELRTLPGVGEYTCAAIASIAYGESVAVVDGNVERVLLRVTGRPEDMTAAGKRFVRGQADALVPQKRMADGMNAPGDHNQAMMELGATLCLPKAPLCLQCPVYEVCRTRGEHVTGPRGRQTSRQAAFLLATRKDGTTTEVLLERRSEHASLMPGMLELPPLPIDAVEGREPLLTLRHSITNTNYYVAVYAESKGRLRGSVPASEESLKWFPVQRLGQLPLTGLARKVLKRIDLTSVLGPETPEQELARRL